MKADVDGNAINVELGTYVDSNSVRYFTIRWRTSSTLTYFLQFGSNGNAGFYRSDSGTVTSVKTW